MKQTIENAFGKNYNFAAGETLLVGVPGGAYDGQVLFISYVNFQNATVLTHNLSTPYKDYDMRRLLSDLHYEFAEGIDKEDKIRWGGPEDTENIFMVLPADRQGDWKVEEYIGDLALVIDEESVIAAAQGSLDNEFLLIAGQTTILLTDLAKLLDNGQLIVVCVNNRICYDCA